MCYNQTVSGKYIQKINRYIFMEVNILCLNLEKRIIDLLTIIVKSIGVMYRTPYFNSLLSADSINIVITQFSRGKVQYEAFVRKAKNTAAAVMVYSSV